MATAFDSIEKMPVWQRLVAWVVIAVGIVVGWYLLFYSEAVVAREAAERGLDKAQAELERLKQKKANFLEEQRKHEQREEDLRKKMEVLPMNASTVDNLMQTFQQQARQIGLSIESWNNEPEQTLDFYARLPIKIRVTGTWAQAGEFFRRVNELRQIVSIEKLSLSRDGEPEEPGGHPPLDIQFEAATYRFLSEQERSAAQGTRRTGSRRNQKKG